ncbi:hypothetical protein WMY93_010215 [Mugilogobius chulae]|uniref:Uncharacterized protein n=1 Tax=Mugilogobius chulae TaxID=88201 RepID=A0AAW0PCG0_9GOBI
MGPEGGRGEREGSERASRSVPVLSLLTRAPGVHRRERSGRFLHAQHLLKVIYAHWNGKCVGGWVWVCGLRRMEDVFKASEHPGLRGLRMEESRVKAFLMEVCKAESPHGGLFNHHQLFTLTSDLH